MTAFAGMAVEHESPEVRALARAIRRARTDTGSGSVEKFGNEHGLSWRYLGQIERAGVNPGWLVIARTVAACGLTMRAFGAIYDEELARERNSPQLIRSARKSGR